MLGGVQCGTPADCIDELERQLLSLFLPPTNAFIERIHIRYSCGRQEQVAQKQNGS